MMRKRTLGPIVGCFASSFFIASTSYANGYFGSVSASALHSDNGNKSVDNPISELQELYILNVGALYENEIGKFEADYGASYRSFSENTQPNKSTLDGHSSLQLGRQADIAELLVEHSRQTLLNTPDSVDLTENQEEREVLTISPTLNGHFTGADTVFLRGNFSDIHYLESEINNSTRSGATLGVIHKITEIDTLGFEAESTKVEFENFPTSDYTLRSAALTYSARLRQLSYSIQVGKNQSETDAGEKYSSPSYLVSATYKSGVNTFGVNLNREITDTSFGNGNKNVSAGHSSDGGIGQSSQIDRKRVDLQWASTAICTRCTLTASVYQVRDEYLALSEKANEIGSNITASYAVSASATVSLNWLQSDNRLSNESLGENYKRTIVGLDYNYRIGKSFNIKASYSDEKRVDDNASTGYREKLVGLSLGYSF